MNQCWENDDRILFMNKVILCDMDSETTSYLTLDRETQMTSQEGRSSAFTQQKHIMIYPFASALNVSLRIFIENKHLTNCRI